MHICIAPNKRLGIFLEKNGIKRDGSETRQKDTLVHYVVILKKKQLIKFWPSRAPGKGVCGSAAGRKLLAPPYYSQHAVFASPLSVFFSFSISFVELVPTQYNVYPT